VYPLTYGKELTVDKVFRQCPFENEEILRYFSAIASYLPGYVTIMEHDEHRDDVLQTFHSYSSLKEVYVEGVYRKEPLCNEQLYSDEVSILLLLCPCHSLGRLLVTLFWQDFSGTYNIYPI
jgi:hypothetical protein